MSTIKFTVQTQAIDFFPNNLGEFQIVFNDGVRDHTFVERLNPANLGTGWVKEILFPLGGNLQAIEIGKAFLRDYYTVGGTGTGLGAKNISYAIDGNEVEFTAKRGTFVSATYTGNHIVVGTPVINNSAQTTSLNIYGTRNPSVGGCTTIEYNFAASGGVPPYTLRSGTQILDASWDGSSKLLNLTRGVPHNINISDADGTYKSSIQISPRKLVASEFQISQAVSGLSSDITITNLNPVLGTTPLQYSLDAGVTWQSNNIFTGLLGGNYELYVRDAYGCTLTKAFEVTDAIGSDPITPENPRYFNIVDANSFIFSEAVDFGVNVKKNFRNTLSHQELAQIPYTIDQDFDTDDFIITQFQSSYLFHIITLVEEDGGKIDLPVVKIQKNLGSAEKVDCKLFDKDGSIAVYFDGGNEYEPDTDTVIGASIHSIFTPEWGIVDQVVNIEGVGNVSIINTGYDEIRGGYFVVSALSVGEIDSKIQVVFNKQDYDLFEFLTPIAYISKKARLVIEYGQSFTEIEGNPWTSEWIVHNRATEDYLLLEWSDPKNRGGMVFQSGIKCLNRLQGEFRPVFENETKTFKGDNNAYALDMDAYQNYEVFVEAISAKEAFKLNIASGLDGFIVNNMPLTRTDNPSIEAIEGTNLYTWRCECAFGVNALGYDQDERVLNISTGVEDGGSILIDVNDDGKYRIEEGGQFIVVDGKYVAVP